jgi:hypothetical protein
VDGGSGYLTQGGYALHFAGLSHAHYSLEVRYQGLPGAETVVDGKMNPILGDLVPEQLGNPYLFVFRDGRVLTSPFAGAKALAIRPGRRPGKLSRPDRSPPVAR